MIQTILTESTITTATVPLSPAVVTSAEQLPLFADMVLLADAEPSVAVAEDAAETIVTGDFAEVQPDEVALIGEPDKPAKHAVTEATAVPAFAPATDRSEKSATPTTLLQEPRKQVDAKIPDLSISPQDRSATKDGNSVHARNSIAQSAIESRLPQVPTASAKPETERAHQPPLSKASTPEKILEVPKASAPMPQHAMPIKAAPQYVPLAEPHVLRAPGDPRAKAPDPTVTTTQSGMAAVQAGQPPAVALAKTVAAALPQTRDISAKLIDAEPSFGVNVGERQASVLSTMVQPGPNASTETARHVATQISVAVANHPNKATEIALNPEELGRVRLSMTAVDGTLTLHVVAERPETQDLLRRHIDVLAQEFRDLGYDTISFSFGQEGQAATDHDHKADEDQGLTDLSEDQPTTNGPVVTPTSGLDLRL